MAYKIISYKDIYKGSKCINTVRLPDTDEDFFFVYIAEIDGKHYAKVMDIVDMPEQDDIVEYQEHDLTIETDLKASLKELSLNNNDARRMRKLEYPSEGEQVGAMMKYFKQLKAEGTELPEELDNLLTQIDEIKSREPKDPDLE